MSSASTWRKGRSDGDRGVRLVVRIGRTFAASAEEDFDTWTSPEVMRRWFHPGRSASVRVLVLPPTTELGGWGLRRSLEQKAEVRRDERIGRRYRVGVVDDAVLARKRDPARPLAQPVLELGPDLA